MGVVVWVSAGMRPTGPVARTARGRDDPTDEMTRQPAQDRLSGPLDLRDVPIDGCTVPGCTRPRGSRGLCPGHRARLARSGDVRADVPLGGAWTALKDDSAARTEALLDAAEAAAGGDPDRCWEWPGTRASNGYGRPVGGTARWAHRVAYERAHGPIPPGLVVMHSCDSPPCVNPSHLRADTQRANAHDALAKGRMRPHGRPARPRVTEDTPIW